MFNENEPKKEKEAKDKEPKIKPGEIKGKIDINDTRERRDGPGGN